MGRGFKIFLGFVAGLIIGESIPIIGYIIATNFLGVFDRDGGGAMGAIFILGPICAFFTAIILAIVVARRASSR